jgi:4'-phosphopantetheinyl transferase EntD
MTSFFAPLLPEWVRVAEIEPALVHPAMLPTEEQSFVVGAVDRRRREFAAGRILVRQLLESLGQEAILGRASDGRPDWPAGIVGSITHCATLAAAAVARQRDCAGIGIDIEVEHALPQGVARLLFSEQEQRWIEHGDSAARAQTVLRAFCAKEALFKAIYPLTRRIPPVGALTVEPCATGQGFVGRLGVELAPFHKDTVLKGRWSARGGHVGAAVVIARTICPL